MSGQEEYVPCAECARDAADAADAARERAAHIAALVPLIDLSRPGSLDALADHLIRLGKDAGSLAAHAEAPGAYGPLREVEAAALAAAGALRRLADHAGRKD